MPSADRRIVISILSRSFFAICACVVITATLKADSREQNKASVAVPAEFKDADAVILEWDQSWKKATDGGVIYHELKRVLMRNDRANGAFADPRITYNSEFETVRILRARTILPNGKTFEVPKYSFNEASPGETAGWPAFAKIKQDIISFSAIEPGVVLELEFEKTTKPGMHRHIEIEARADADYPIVARSITFPDGKKREWKNLPAAISEPQSKSWKDMETYVSYTDADSPKAWASEIVAAIREAAEPNDAIKKKAEEWTKDKLTDVEKAKALRDKVSARVNMVGAPADWTGDKLRPAADVFASNYASRIESASLLLTLYRAAGLEARPFFIIREKGAAAVRAAISDYGVSIRGSDRVSYWSPSSGRIADPGTWGGARRYDDTFTNLKSSRKEPEQFVLPENSCVDVRMQLTLDEKAGWTATLNLKAAGIVIPTDGLETDGSRRDFVKRVIDRVLPEAAVDDVNVLTLSDQSFACKANLHSSKPLESVDGDHLLELVQQPPWSSWVSLPLARSERKTPIQMDVAFHEHVQIDFTLPEGWLVSVKPMMVDVEAGDAGEVHQRLVEESGRISLTRETDLGKTITVEDFGDLRKALNTLQSRKARTLVFSPGTSRT